MADPKKSSKQTRKPNAVVAYFRATRAELKKVRWPTLEQGWSMTKIVLAVTFGMAIFLGVLDFYFGWLLGGVISGNVWLIVLSVVTVALIFLAAWLIGREERA